MKTALKIMILFFLTLSFTACEKEDHSKIKIGVILPIEHKALREIVQGFTEKLRELYPYPIQIKVMNAQGDINLQKAIIQQMHDQHYTIIVPVATGPTQMTAAMIHDKAIISLAANFTAEERLRGKAKNLAVVHDEISPQKIIYFIHAAYPQLTHLTLIHSTSDKIFNDVKEAIAAGNHVGITIKPLMVATLPELVSAAQALPAQTQGILILKDNLIVSGIGTLARTASERHIPLITLDQSSVEGGAGFSLGVHERQIGEEGAQLAVKILNGEIAGDLPIVEMKQLFVFVNKTALAKEQQALNPVETTAKNLHYSLEFVRGD